MFIVDKWKKIFYFYRPEDFGHRPEDFDPTKGGNPPGSYNRIRKENKEIKGETKWKNDEK